MKILQLSPYCDPEQISSTHLMQDLTTAFICNGHSIEKYVPTPTRGVTKEVRNKYKRKKYETLYDGQLIIHRFSMFREGKNPIIRAFRYFCVNVVQYIKGINARGVDIIFSGSTPPIQGLLCGMVKRKLKVPFVYNLQDIFPDSLVNTGLTRNGSILWKIGHRIENYTYESADKIIVISEGFKQNILNKGVPENKIVVVPNWIDTEAVYSVDRENNTLFKKYNLDPDLFYICYSGNVGHTQNLELLLTVAERLDIPDVRFVIIGEGVAKENLSKKIQERNITNVIMLPFQPYEDIHKVFSLGDVGLIISKKGIGTNSVPSKTWSILAAERPILASFDLSSQLADELKRIGCGLVSDADDIESFIENITTFYNDRRLLDEMGKLGRNYVTSELDKNVCTQKYCDVITACIKG